MIRDLKWGVLQPPGSAVPAELVLVNVQLTQLIYRYSSTNPSRGLTSNILFWQTVVQRCPSTKIYTVYVSVVARIDVGQLH